VVGSTGPHLTRSPGRTAGRGAAPAFPSDHGIRLRAPLTEPALSSAGENCLDAVETELDLKSQRYGFVGTEDWSMYPLLQPGSLVVIAMTRRKVADNAWASEFERADLLLRNIARVRLLHGAI